jgi:hypothetical protein
MYRDRRGYYYHSRRLGRHVVKEYHSNNPLALVLAQGEAEDKAEAHNQLKNEQERLDAATAPLVDFDKEVAALMQATLEAAGYRQHKRGGWRKQRGKKTNSNTAG